MDTTHEITVSLKDIPYDVLRIIHTHLIDEEIRLLDIAMCEKQRKRVYFKLSFFCNSLRNLQWAYKNGCRWNLFYKKYPKATALKNIANQIKDPKVLRYFRAKCSIGDQSCIIAQKGGHIECLRWAIETQNCFVDFSCKHAAYNGHLEPLKYALKYGCNCCVNECIFNASVNHKHNILDYYKSRYCDFQYTIEQSILMQNIFFFRWAFQSLDLSKETYLQILRNMKDSLDIVNMDNIQHMETWINDNY